MIGGSGIVDETFERRQYERMYGGKVKGNRTEEARERSSGRRETGQENARVKARARVEANDEGEWGPTDATLAVALQRLDAFEFVGLASRYEDSLTLFKLVVSWKLKA